MTNNSDKNIAMDLGGKSLSGRIDFEDSDVDTSRDANKFLSRAQDEEFDIEIEKPAASYDIKAHDLIKNYKDIKLLSMNPSDKRQILLLIKEVQSDLQNIKNSLTNFCIKP